MSVPIIENWSKVSAKILGINDSSDISEFSEVEMHVNRVEPVDDFPNLLSDAEGSNLVVHFPSDLLQQMGLSSGNRVSCWVRKAGLSRCFVHRDHVKRLSSGSTSSNHSVR